MSKNSPSKAPAAAPGQTPTPAPDQPGNQSYAHIGAYLGIATAIAILAYTFNMFFTGSEDPMPFKLAGLVVGGLQLLLCVQSLQKKRAAWAFALSLNGTLAVVFLFGAPKVRDGLDLSLMLSMLPCISFAVITSLLATGADDF